MQKSIEGGQALAEQEPEKAQPTEEELLNLEEVQAELDQKWGVPDLSAHIEEAERKKKKPAAEVGKNAPPELKKEDFLNKEGKVVDFSQAKDYHQLIDMIRDEGEITNSNGLALSAETIINYIHKLTYQDIRNYKSTDYTNITLRHRLRETVANLIEDYKQTNEYKVFAGLALSGAKDEDELFAMINQRDQFIDSNGNPTSKNKIFEYIRKEDGRDYHLLPDPIRNKIIEFNKQKNKPVKSEEPKKGLLSRVGSRFKKLKFWGK